MTHLQLSLLISYTLIACYLFYNWLRFSLRHPTSTPEEKFLSFVMLLITTVFWPVIIPVSCWKIIKNRQLEPSTVIPIILAIFAVSISYCVSL